MSKDREKTGGEGDEKKADAKPKLTSVEQVDSPPQPPIPDGENVGKDGAPLGQAIESLLGNNNELQNKVDFLTQRVEGLIAEKTTLLRALDTITRQQAQIDQQRQREQARAAQEKIQSGD